MIKYRAECRWLPKITKVKIVRETKGCVFLRTTGFEHSEITERKITNNYQYFDTFDEAKAFLVETYQGKVDSIRREFEVAKSYLGNVKGMREE